MKGLPSLPGRRVIAALERAGFRVVRTKGQHHFMQHQSDPGRQTVIPRHRKDLPVGAMRAILRQAAITPDECDKLLGTRPLGLTAAAPAAYQAHRSCIEEPR